MRTLLLLLAFLITPQLHAQIRLTTSTTFADIVIPSDLQGQVGEFVYVKSSVPNVVWQVLDPGLKMVPSTYLKSSDTGIFLSNKVGKYRIIVWEKDSHNPPTFGLITISEGPPNPIDPPPPNPIDPPKPTILSKPRLAVYYESSKLRDYPRPQQLIFSSKNILSYLDTHVTKTNGFPDYRFFDKDIIDFSKVDKIWQDMSARPRRSIPWVVIFDDNNFIYEGELPVTDVQFQTLLQKYMGN
jgi:hypothetical protein